MKKKIIPVLIVISLIIILTGALVVSTLVEKYTPTKERESLSEYYGMTDENQVPIIRNCEVSEEYGQLIDGAVYLSYDYIRSSVNSRFYWDADEDFLLYAMDREMIIAVPDSTSYSIGQAYDDIDRTEQASHPVVKVVDDTVYVSLDFILPYSNVSCETADAPTRVILTTEESEITTASLSKSSEIRHKGGIKSPILADTAAGEKVTVLAKDETWTKVMNDNGVIGYVKSNLLKDEATEKAEVHAADEAFTHILKDEKIVMAWHQVTNRTANSTLESVLKKTKGINVISPTWFYLNDDEGNIADIGSSDYVNYCHARNIDVWGLVSNLENPDVSSTAVLTSASARKRLTERLIAAAKSYGLDGINVDFESLSSEVGDGFIQFIRELSIRCAENELCLSVDNYVPSGYTAFYNRKDQALFADYVIIMAYDEHFSGSDAGSVASLGWVTEGVTATLESVPAKQTILGVPFYTRVWDVEEKNETEYTTNGSAVYGMDGAKKLLADAGVTAEWNDEFGQYYAQWGSGDDLHQVWLEEEESIGKKLELISTHDLAGASFWKLGFENSSIWNTISDAIN